VVVRGARHPRVSRAPPASGGPRRGPVTARSAGAGWPAPPAHPATALRNSASGGSRHCETRPVVVRGAARDHRASAGPPAAASQRPAPEGASGGRLDFGQPGVVVRGASIRVRRWFEALRYAFGGGSRRTSLPCVPSTFGLRRPRCLLAVQHGGLRPPAHGGRPVTARSAGAGWPESPAQSCRSARTSATMATRRSREISLVRSRTTRMPSARSRASRAWSRCVPSTCEPPSTSTASRSSTQ